jgi:hypothetical protein
MKTLKIIMPSAGDMELGNQDGGIIELNPIFYGNTSMGPHVQVVDEDGSVSGRYKITLSRTGVLRLEKQKEIDNEN